jgi:Asp-tRNA(Asn)/Glu-tRNA(Gln) amidotransferase A subunit family amidase
MSGFRPVTVADYAAAYKERRTAPVDVAQWLVQAVADADRARLPLRPFIAMDAGDLMGQAAAATDRHSAGRPLGPLDGVPIAVKDEIDQAGYPTTVGTRFLGREAAERDATAVGRLRAAGALLVGKANMHEIGLGTTGINPHHGSARNPYDPERITGGSSSGSAAIVASGLCPIAIGADGGGSIRIPASLCGVSGIKPTYGRVSETGAAPLCWSVAHIGPLAGTLTDAALALDLMSGPDPRDPNTAGQPPLDLGEEIGNMQPNVAGLRVGWCEQWAAKARPDVRNACREALDGLGKAGAEIREVRIDHLDLVPMVEMITIGVELAASQAEHRRQHQQEYGADTRLLLELASQISGVDYVRAQRLRTRIAEAFARALNEVDLLASPATAITAPPLPPAAERDGLQDDAVLDALTAFSFAGNLTGLPAVVLPVAHDSRGLPIGLQLMARHWDERSAIHAGLVVERAAPRQAPQVLFHPPWV